MNKDQLEYLELILDSLENFLNELLNPEYADIQPCYNSKLKQIQDDISGFIHGFKECK